jgi:hypothetical protein
MTPAVADDLHRSARREDWSDHEVRTSKVVVVFAALRPKLSTRHFPVRGAWSTIAVPQEVFSGD